MSELVKTKTVNALAVGSEGFDLDPSDIEISRINVVQKMSETDAPLGALVLSRKHVLTEAEVPIKAIAVTAQKGWRENIPYDEDEIPQIAWSKEQADIIEADSSWGKMAEFAEITLLIEKPKGCKDDEGFQVPIGDKDYALGKINVSKNAYRSTFKRLVTFALLNNGIPVHNKIWSLVSEPLSSGKYTWHNPSLTATKEDTPKEVIAFAAKFQS
jgi:hypothetical protein|tara:strand:- start:1091 stop:1732 length:642 start_codon:yes stop_codon:yes gene_type:complete